MQHNYYCFFKGQRRTLLQQGHRVTSTHNTKYISHMAQYFRLLLPNEMVGIRGVEFQPRDSVGKNSILPLPDILQSFSAQPMTAVSWIDC